MAYTDINSEDRLVQAAFAAHLEQVLGWDGVYAWNEERFGPEGTLGRASEREVVLVRDLRAALNRLNPQLPPAAIESAVAQLTQHDHARSLLQHNQGFYKLLRDGVPVSYRDAAGQLRHAQAAVIDFRQPLNNRFGVGPLKQCHCRRWRFGGQQIALRGRCLVPIAGAQRQLDHAGLQPLSWGEFTLQRFLTHHGAHRTVDAQQLVVARHHLANSAWTRR